MKISFVIFLFFIFYSNFSIAISKKESLNKEKSLIEKQTMLNAGTWDLYMKVCSGKKRKEFRNQIAKLSWPDYKNYNSGGTKYDQNYTVSCSKKDTKDGADFYDWIISTLKNKLKNKISNNSSRNNNDNKNTNSENFESGNPDIESKLKKLKSLFDKELITREEYDTKRKEILDKM